MLSEDYKQYFKMMMDRFKIKSLDKLSPEEKKKFFTAVDKSYKAKNEDLKEMTPPMSVSNPKAHAKLVQKALDRAKERQLPGTKTKLGTALQNKNHEKHSLAKKIIDKIKGKKKDKPKTNISKSDSQKYADLYGGGAKVENVAPNHDGKAAPHGSGYKEVDEGKKQYGQKLTDDFFKSVKKFEQEVIVLGKMATKIRGDRTDEKIILKMYKKHMGPFIELIRSWNDTTQNNPHISEGKIQVQGIGMYDDKTLKKKILGMTKDLQKLAKNDEWSKSSENAIKALGRMWGAYQDWSRNNESVNESLLKQIKQAEKIAKSMSGNMTGAVKGIEKIRRGLSRHKRVRVALRKYNESVDEGKLSEDYKNSEWEVYVADEKGKEKIVKKAKSKRAGVILYNKLINSGLMYYEVGMRVVKESVNEGIFGKFDTGAGFKGNGMTVYDRNQEKSGDFRDIVHIAPNGKITIYDKNVKKEPKLMQSLNKISQEFKKTFKESVNEDVFAIVDKYNDKKQDYDQVYFKDNNLNKVKKHMKKMGSKYGKMNLIRVKTNGKMSLVEGMDKRQAGETLKQLGGNKFIMMTGAKNFAVGPKGMGFKIGRNSKGVNYIRIDLDRGRDLYNMEFIQMRGGNLKVKSKVKGVYNDQLQKMFTKHTGMYTSLGTMGR